MGVIRFDDKRNEIAISIPKEYQEIAKETQEENNLHIDEIYRRWIINGIVHEDIHWVIRSEIGKNIDEVNEITNEIEPYR